nr:MAG TPA: hypothetical protein [Caudoviricetes sp.]
MNPIGISKMRMSYIDITIGILKTISIYLSEKNKS